LDEGTSPLQCYVNGRRLIEILPFDKLRANGKKVYFGSNHIEGSAKKDKGILR